MIYWFRFSIYSWVKAGQHIKIEIFFVILDLEKVPELPRVIRTTLAGEEEINFGYFIRNYILDINFMRDNIFCVFTCNEKI